MVSIDLTHGTNPLLLAHMIESQFSRKDCRMMSRPPLPHRHNHNSRHNRHADIHLVTAQALFTSTCRLLLCAASK
jgi:hypothetical protein